MHKDKVETICRNAGIRPETREKIGDVDLFLADGFSLPPHKAYAKFGITPFEFPHGMYVTLWWVSRDVEKLDVGRPLFFDVKENSKYARLNAARRDARTFVENRKLAH